MNLKNLNKRKFIGIPVGVLLIIGVVVVVFKDKIFGEGFNAYNASESLNGNFNEQMDSAMNSAAGLKNEDETLKMSQMQEMNDLGCPGMLFSEFAHLSKNKNSGNSIMGNGSSLFENAKEMLSGNGNGNGNGSVKEGMNGNGNGNGNVNKGIMYGNYDLPRVSPNGVNVNGVARGGGMSNNSGNSPYANAGVNSGMNGMNGGSFANGYGNGYGNGSGVNGVLGDSQTAANVQGNVSDNRQFPQFPADQLNASELLPKQQSQMFADLFPSGQGALSDRRDFLTSNQSIGINTQSSSLKNANYGIRSDPPNPQRVVSVWNQTTISQDNNRRHLEIGEC